MRTVSNNKEKIETMLNILFRSPVKTRRQLKNSISLYVLKAQIFYRNYQQLNKTTSNRVILFKILAIQKK